MPAFLLAFIIVYWRLLTFIVGPQGSQEGAAFACRPRRLRVISPRQLEGGIRGSRRHRQSPSAHRRRPGDGARRDHAARGGIPCRGRARRRSLQADQAVCRDPRVPQGEGQSQGPVELLAHRVRQGLWPHHGRIRLSRRRNGLVPARLRGLQLLGPRHGQYGSDRALRLARAEGALAARISSRGARVPPIS